MKKSNHRFDKEYLLRIWKGESTIPIGENLASAERDLRRALDEWHYRQSVKRHKERYG